MFVLRAKQQHGATHPHLKALLLLLPLRERVCCCGIFFLVATPFLIDSSRMQRGYDRQKRL